MDQRCYEFEAVIESTPDGKGPLSAFPWISGRSSAWGG